MITLVLKRERGEKRVAMDLPKVKVFILWRKGEVGFVGDGKDNQHGTPDVP